MRTFPKIIFLLLGLAVGSSMTGQVAGSEEPPPTVVLPVHPDRLLRALPGTPENWKLLHSRGRSDLYGTTAPVSFAQRRFEIPRLNEEGKPLPPGRLDVSLMDVGSLTEMVQSMTQRMDALREAKNGSEIRIASNTRANFTETADGRVLFQATVGDRLILHGTFRAMESAEALAAMELLGFEKIESLNRILPNKTITSWTYPTFEFDEVTGKRHESSISIHRAKPGSEKLDPPPILSTPPSAPN